MSHRRAKRVERAALAALAVTCVLTVAKALLWVSTMSLAVLSQTLDSMLDVVALALMFLGVRVSARPADESHHYGHGKAEHLVTFAQTLLLGIVVLGIAVEALRRLTGSATDVEAPWYALGAFAVSAVIDGVRVRSLARVAKAERSDALAAGAANLGVDIGTTLVTVASLALVRAGVEGADAVGGLVVAAAAAVVAIRLGKRSVDVLMDRAPAAPVEAIEAAAAGAPGVAETRRVRVRTAGPQLFADVTVAAQPTASLERAHDIAGAVEREIERVAPGTDAVVHVEPASEVRGLANRVMAAASRAEGVHEVHNVLIYALDEYGRNAFHVMLHAKVKPGVSVEEAHELSDRIEANVARELGPGVRVDTHIEPLKEAARGTDVTAKKPDIAATVRNLALSEEDVVDCHEVVVTSTGSELSIMAHVRGRGNLSIERMHDASERIEKAIHSAHPDVGAVVIHFEPS